MDEFNCDRELAEVSGQMDSSRNKTNWKFELGLMKATKGRKRRCRWNSVGDEGKGKLVDWLTSGAQGVVRFRGGHNAGHTLRLTAWKTAPTFIPSGIMRPGEVLHRQWCGASSAAKLFEEIEGLERAAGGKCSRLASVKLALILPFMQL